MGLKVVCPKCGRVGTLVKRKIGWYVNHSHVTSHYIKKYSSIELVPDYLDLTLVWYPGGDHFLLKYIYKLIPPHVCYVEVFGGGAPVLLNKPPSKVEVYNDLDGNLYNLFKVVKEKPQEFAEKLDLVLYSRQQYYEFLRKLRSGELKDDVERATAFYYVINASFFGKPGAGFATSRTANEAMKFFGKLSKIRAIHERLKRVVVENLDFRECIKRYDSKDTFFYCDPPHLYISTEKSSVVYPLGFTDSDYMDLLNLLERIEGKFLLKQTGYVEYVATWAKERGFYVREFKVVKAMEKLDTGQKRATWRVQFIANYEI